MSVAPARNGRQQFLGRFDLSRVFSPKRNDLGTACRPAAAVRRSLRHFEDAGRPARQPVGSFQVEHALDEPSLMKDSMVMPVPVAWKPGLRSRCFEPLAAGADTW